MWSGRSLFRRGPPQQQAGDHQQKRDTDDPEDVIEGKDPRLATDHAVN